MHLHSIFPHAIVKGPSVLDQNDSMVDIVHAWLIHIQSYSGDMKIIGLNKLFYVSSTPPMFDECLMSVNWYINTADFVLKIYEKSLHQCTLSSNMQCHSVKQ